MARPLKREQAVSWSLLAFAHEGHRRLGVAVERTGEADRREVTLSDEDPVAAHRAFEQRSDCEAQVLGDVIVAAGVMIHAHHTGQPRLAQPDVRQLLNECGVVVNIEQSVAQQTEQCTRRGPVAAVRIAPLLDVDATGPQPLDRPSALLRVHSQSRLPVHAPRLEEGLLDLRELHLVGGRSLKDDHAVEHKTAGPTLIADDWISVADSDRGAIERESKIDADLVLDAGPIVLGTVEPNGSGQVLDTHKARTTGCPVRRGRECAGAWDVDESKP